ncbi:hypothetical protein MATL_G00115990 [Megalops atlanticus]|uniref:Peptidoglycan-recognition protein n=1 Tax=Megalops atlanticus TaxID=7932 RepID=A0A9D3PWU0_MEGAT|nr:hypothetical protein MATL_G00115990 [Megalops atlanticus]
MHSPGSLKMKMNIHGYFFLLFSLRCLPTRAFSNATVKEMDGQIRGKASEETRPSVDSITAGMCPNVVSRRQWGAVAPRSEERLQGPALRAVIHHTALWPCHGPGECRLQLAHIQELHMRGRDFHDIGYNFLIGGDGTVYEGRGWGVVGAHAKGNNHDSLGIAFMGNFNNETPTPAALSSTQKLLQCGVALGHLHPRYALLGHRDLAKTECPGEQLYAVLWLLAQC